MSLKQYSTPLLRCLRLWLLAALLPGYARLEASQGDNNSNETEIPDEFDPLSVKGQGPLAILAYPQGQGPKNQDELKARYHSLMRKFHTDRKTSTLSREAWQKQTEQAQAIVEANAMVLAMLKDKKDQQEEPNWVDDWITKWLAEKTSAMQMNLGGFFSDPFQVDTQGDTYLWQLYKGEKDVQLASVLSQMARLDDGDSYAHMIQETVIVAFAEKIRSFVLQRICFPQLVNIPSNSSKYNSLLYAALSEKKKLVLYALLKNPALDIHPTNGGESPFAWLIQHVADRTAKRKEKDHPTLSLTPSTSEASVIIAEKPEDEDDYTDDEVQLLFTRVFLPAVPSSSDMKLFNKAKKGEQSLWDFYNIDKNIVWYGQRRQWAGRGLQIALLAIPFLLAYGVYRLYATKKRQEKEATPYVSPLEKEVPLWKEIIEPSSLLGELVTIVHYLLFSTAIGAMVISHDLLWGRSRPPALIVRQVLFYWGTAAAVQIALLYTLYGAILLWCKGISKIPSRVAEARWQITTLYSGSKILCCAIALGLMNLYHLRSLPWYACPLSLSLLALLLYGHFYCRRSLHITQRELDILEKVWSEEKTLFREWEAAGQPATQLGKIASTINEKVETALMKERVQTVAQEKLQAKSSNIIIVIVVDFFQSLKEFLWHICKGRLGLE